MKVFFPESLGQKCKCTLYTSKYSKNIYPPGNCDVSLHGNLSVKSGEVWTTEGKSQIYREWIIVKALGVSVVP